MLWEVSSLKQFSNTKLIGSTSMSSTSITKKSIDEASTIIKSIDRMSGGKLAASTGNPSRFAS